MGGQVSGIWAAECWMKKGRHRRPFFAILQLHAYLHEPGRYLGSMVPAAHLKVKT